jgi:hypothetical protein
MPARPADTRLPLDLAQQRIDLDTLLRDRVRALLVLADSQTGHATEAERERASDDAASVDAQVRWFAEQVERHNDTAQQTAGRGKVLRYDEAVVIEGERGMLVVDATDYDLTPLGYRAEVGRVEQLIAGPDLYVFLRTGNGPAVEQLGLA